MDQPTEQIPSANVARTDGHRVRRFGSWRGEAEGAVQGGRGWSARHRSGASDRDAADLWMTVGSRHSALVVSITRSGVGIGVRCLEGRHDHPGPFRANDLVERPAELRVPVSDEEPDGR